MKRKVPQAARSQSGYQQGYRHGYHIGCCQSILSTVPQIQYPAYPQRILYIPQGFEAIDRGILQALDQLSAEVFLGQPDNMYRLAAEIRPDLVLVMNGLHVFPANHLEMVMNIRSLGLLTAIWFADDPYFTDNTPQIALQYDYVFTHELSCVELYREIGCSQVHYLPLAAAGSIYKPTAVETGYHSDICFIGSAFPNRLSFFNQAAPSLSRYKIVLMGALWNHLSQSNIPSWRIKLDWTPIEETVKYYNGARIVVNLHRNPIDPVYSKNARQIQGYSINPRTYEIAACGAFQMTDIRQDLEQHFVAGSELITYTSAADFVEKARFYLNNDKERSKVAARGLSRTMKEHTYQERLSRLLGIVFTE